MPDITFIDRDFRAINSQEDDPMVITIDLANCEVRKTLVDQGSSVDVLYWRTFRKMGLKESEIIPLNEQIVGFARERVDTKRYVDLHTRFGEPHRGQKTISVRYIVVDVNISYNALLGQPSLNKLGAIVSTLHLAMKFPSDRGTVATVYADQKTASECYVASLKMKSIETIAKRNVAQRMVAMTDLDPRINDDVRMKPSNDVTEWQLAGEGQNTRLGGAMTESKVKRVTKLLADNRDLFAWTAEDMPGVDPRVMSHRLSICKEARPVAQKKRRMSEEKRNAAALEVQKLLEARFIKEIHYTTWLANVVLLTKSNGQWRMCVDYTSLNKACPKDAYPLPSIDRLVDGAAITRCSAFLTHCRGTTKFRCTTEMWGRRHLSPGPQTIVIKSCLSD